MATLAKALRSIGGAGTIDRVLLAASIVFLAVVALEARATIAGMSPEVTIGSAEALR